LLYRFATTDIQLKAKEVIQEALGDNYLVAINLAPATPDWLKSLGAMPMKLGLDLRGGVHFLLQVDVDSVMKQRVEGELHNIGLSLRDERIRYSGITRKSENVVVLQFRNKEALDVAYSFVNSRYNEFVWEKQTNNNEFNLQGTLSPASI
jgi:preprotein translocase subunit SecD